MPFITQERREDVFKNGLDELLNFLNTIIEEDRKGYLAFTVMYLAKYSFDRNYFGRSTSTDAVRSAFVELKKELDDYERKKKEENGEV